MVEILEKIAPASSECTMQRSLVPELEVLFQEQLTQVHEVLKAYHQNTIRITGEQGHFLAELRRENEELRTRASGLAPKATSLPEGETVEKPHAGAAAQLAPLVFLERPSSDAVEPSDRGFMSLPGEVLREVDAASASRATHSGTPSDRDPNPQCLSIMPKEPSSIPPVFMTEGKRPSVSVRISHMSHTILNRTATENLPGVPSKTLFADASTMKERVRQAILKPDYHVSQYYKTSGPWQWIARSSMFDNFTLIIIVLNAIWLMVDTDSNSESVIFEAKLEFQLLEYFFFVYFVAEWYIRFMAFRHKRDGLRDHWFVFDTSLVILMVMDTFVMGSVIMLAGFESHGMGGVAVIRTLRLLRLSRMMRIARVLRAAPELMILIKGMVGAMRSVGFTLILLSGVIYIFAIVFRTVTDGTALGQRYFPSVPAAAFSLLFDGTMPDVAPMVYEVAGEHWALGVLLTVFISLASLMVMNMLVGVLVEVVCTVSAVEKEQLEATFLKGHMLHLLRGLDEDGDVMISKHEFGRLLEKSKAIKALQEVGVDVVGLAELSDFIYKDKEALSFPDFMEMVLQLRGTNVATVKTIVDLRMFMTTELARFEEDLLAKLHQVGNVELQDPGVRIMGQPFKR